MVVTPLAPTLDGVVSSGQPDRVETWTRSSLSSSVGIGRGSSLSSRTWPSRVLWRPDRDGIARPAGLREARPRRSLLPTQMPGSPRVMRIGIGSKSPGRHRECLRRPRGARPGEYQARSPCRIDGPMCWPSSLACRGREIGLEAVDRVLQGVKNRGSPRLVALADRACPPQPFRAGPIGSRDPPEWTPNCGPVIPRYASRRPTAGGSSSRTLRLGSSGVVRRRRVPEPQSIDRMTPRGLPATRAWDARGSQVDELLADLESFIPNAMRTTHTPGLNLAISLGADIVLERGFGFSRLDRREPMTPATVTRGGSFGKLYTGVAVLRLVEQGVLDLYATASQYLEDLPIQNPLGERAVTIYDLLTLRSGLASDVVEGRFGPPEPLQDYVRRARDRTQEYGRRLSRWSAKVGSTYQYSNFGIALLGLIVERMNPDRLSLRDYVRMHILEPLGATSTTMGSPHPNHVAPDLLARLSTGYARFGDTCIPSPMIYSPGYPSVEILTTPGDHIRVLIALLHGGQYREHRLLQPESVRFMLTPQARFSEPEVSMDADLWVGLLVELGKVGQRHTYFGHEGGYPWGWWNDSRAYPETKLALVVSSNARDMMRWYNPPDQAVTGLIAEYVVSWLEAHEAAPSTSTPSCSFAWKRSYVMGLMMAERCRGLLGIPDEITKEMVDEMAAGAAVLGQRAIDSPSLWDPVGFRAGLQDMLGVEMTPEGISQFLGSALLPVPREEFKLIALELGRRGNLPLPMPFWANAKGAPVPEID
jgi:CubicO group peptidase (beta-lactamase class C family)